jgi:PAS domain S-box-containing protein
LRENEAKFRALVESSSDCIWEIDEHAVYTYASPQVQTMLGYSVEEILGKTPFDLMPADETEQFREKLDFILQERKPFRLFENICLHKGGRVVFLETSGSPIFDAQNVFKGFRGVDRDITERKQAEKALRASADKLEHTLMQTIETIASTVEARDPYTAGHQRRVAALASAIGREMGLSDHDVRGLYLAACIHDLGKIRIPAEILSKPGALNPIEYEMIKAHSQIGYDIIKDTQFPWPIAQMILQHHERLDGTGYPNNLNGEQMLIEAKILGVADVVEAMSSHRPYRPSLGLDAALQEITDKRGVSYDPVVVDKCIALFRDNLFDFDVKVIK